MNFIGFFQRNDTDLGEIKVFRGKKNYKDVGRVISVNGDTGEVRFLSGVFGTNKQNNNFSPFLNFIN